MSEGEIDQEFIGIFQGKKGSEPTIEILRVRTYKNSTSRIKFKKQFGLTWEARDIPNFAKIPYYKFYKKIRGGGSANKEIIYRLYYQDLDGEKSLHDETTNMYEGIIIELRKENEELINVVHDLREKVGLKQNPDEWDKHERKQLQKLNKRRIDVNGYGDNHLYGRGGIGGYGGL